MMLTIVGGVYREYCMHPPWDELYGSAGRAASVVSRMGVSVELITYLDQSGAEVIEQRAVHEGYKLKSHRINKGVQFCYTHGLSKPEILLPDIENIPLITVDAEAVICFGMIEKNAIVHADYVVYDPQNVESPQSFHGGSSTAHHLAIVLNSYEAREIISEKNKTIREVAQLLFEQEKAEVVVIKRGSKGALIYENGNFSEVPAYQTENVWSIGSGDVFAAQFAYHWIEKNMSPSEAADLASRSAAFYAEYKGYPNEVQLEEFNPLPVLPSRQFNNGFSPIVYLAGPFFSLAQLWLIEQARNNLQDMGFTVFSPYHDVGHGAANDVVHQDLKAIDDCHLMIAVGDGCDSGTIYEIGYARAKDKPVVMYVENEPEEDLKMMEGSNCIICSDYVTAIYKAAWIGVAL